MKLQIARNCFRMIIPLFTCLHLLSVKANETNNLSGLAQIEILKAKSGTGDSGGGNGIDLKMLESFIFDPTELQVAKDLVIPSLLNVQKHESTKAL